MPYKNVVQAGRDQLGAGRSSRSTGAVTWPGSACFERRPCWHMAEIGRNGSYKATQRYGVERPQPPIPWNLRHIEVAPAPTGTQAPLRLFDDLDHAA